MSKIGADPNDRKIGEFWEDEFCKMARRYGWEAWPFQRRRGATFEFNGKSYICPDVWILRRGGKQYICEIKHKNAAKNGCYGFELYRQESMLALEADYINKFGRVEALYVVHNHDAAGGKDLRTNNEIHWHAQRLSFLADNATEGKSRTLYGGQVTENEVPILYYPITLFAPIAMFLDEPQPVFLPLDKVLPLDLQCPHCGKSIRYFSNEKTPPQFCPHCKERVTDTY